MHYYVYCIVVKVYIFQSPGTWRICCSYSKVAVCSYSYGIYTSFPDLWPYTATNNSYFFLPIHGELQRHFYSKLYVL